MSQIDLLIYFPLLFWFILYILFFYYLIFKLIVPLLYYILKLRYNYFSDIQSCSSYIQNVLYILLKK